MSAARQGFSLTGRTIATLWVVLLASPQVLKAQVGLTSGMAQVALVTRVAPRGSIEGVTPHREIGRTSTVREAAVTVRLSANTGYQLVVRRTAAPVSRLWVRAASGEFQELKAGSAVTVAREPRGGGQSDRQVHYRIEATEGVERVMEPLPVRYEIAISPTM